MSAPHLPDPIETSWRWSAASVTIARAVNKLLPVLRWLIEAIETIPKLVENMRSIAAEQQTQRNRMAALEKQVADLRDLDRPRIILKVGQPTEKEV